MSKRTGSDLDDGLLAQGWTTSLLRMALEGCTQSGIFIPHTGPVSLGTRFSVSSSEEVSTTSGRMIDDEVLHSGTGAARSHHLDTTAVPNLPCRYDNLTPPPPPPPHRTQPPSLHQGLRRTEP